jgi:hypothetical protein
MLIAIVTSIFLLGLLDRVTRIGRIDILVMRGRQKLFSIRDLLRDGAIIDCPAKNNWMFDFLDTTLTRAADTLQHFTAYRIIGFTVTETDGEHQDAVSFFKREIERPENSRYKAIANAYERCMGEFLRDRHRWGAFIGRRAADITKFASEVRIKMRDKEEQAIIADPEMSTLERFCPAKR